MQTIVPFTVWGRLSQEPASTQQAGTPQPTVGSVRRVWPSPALPDSVGGRSVPHPNFHGDSGPTALGCKPAVGLLRWSGEEDATNCFHGVWMGRRPH